MDLLKLWFVFGLNMFVEEGGPITEMKNTLNVILGRFDNGFVSQQEQIAEVNTVVAQNQWGKYHRVPSGFHWPRSKNTRIMWDLWLLGNAELGIAGYRHIEPKNDLVAGQKCKIYRTKTAKVMKKLVSIALENNLITSVNDINTSNIQSVFDLSYRILMQMLYPDEADKRIGDLVCDSPKVDVK